jgi:hypothetical protein
MPREEVKKWFAEFKKKWNAETLVLEPFSVRPRNVRLVNSSLPQRRVSGANK